MIDKFWSEYLVDEYKRCRLWTGWDSIHQSHDAEDRDYFQMLDDQRAEGRIQISMVTP